MKKVIITGATGMIGSLVLQNCLQHPDIGQVTILVRQKMGISSNKLVEVIHADFSNYLEREYHIKNQDIAYYCLGVYTGAVPRDEFRTITVHYTKVFAQTLQQYSPQATFCFLSGQGADRTEKSRMMFAKDKGIAENFLLTLNPGQTYIFRPAYIHPSIPRKEPNLSYRIMRSLYPVVRRLYPKGVITSDDLAAAIFHIGLNGDRRIILENRDIKRVAQELQSV
jgi:nucleoside-diphosphate-sugar epimerase